MKNRVFHLFLFTVMSILIFSCAARIITQTNDTAVIQGIGITKVEAKIKAEEKARELFQNFVETQETECTQEYKASGKGSGGSYSARGKTYWSCIIYVKKK